jgi:putative transposase
MALMRSQSGWRCGFIDHPWKDRYKDSTPGITVTLYEIPKWPLTGVNIESEAFMARMARVVVPGEAHHITQRGNRRERVFFSDDDYALCLDLLSERLRKASVAIWAYCLMPNYVHLILCPATPEDRSRASP